MSNMYIFKIFFGSLIIFCVVVQILFDESIKDIVVKAKNTYVCGTAIFYFHDAYLSSYYYIHISNILLFENFLTFY